MDSPGLLFSFLILRNKKTKKDRENIVHLES